MDEPSRDCSCFTLQAADSKPVVVVNAAATLGLLAAFELIIFALICVIVIRRGRDRRFRLPWHRS